MKPIYVYDNISLSPFRMRGVSDKICREDLKNLNIHTLCSFFSENPAAYVMMWKNMVETNRLHMTI